MTTEFDEFKSEIFETLDRAETALLQFDQISAGESSPSLYDEVFRAYHNIKGAAGMMEWNELQHHVHQLENVLMQSKSNSCIPKHLISWFLRGNDVARSIMNNEPFEFDYEATNTPTAAFEKVGAEIHSIDLPEDFTAEVNEALERISTMLIKLEAQGNDVDSVDSLYRDIHSVKGACQLFGLTEASSLFHAMESSLEGIRKTRSSVDNAHVSTLLLCLDLMNICLKSPGQEDTQKEVSFMVSLLAPFTSLVPNETKEPVVEIKKLVALVSAHEQELKSNSQENEKADTSIRVQVSLLDRLMTLMGEMVLVRNQVLQYSNKTDNLEFLNLSQKLDVVTSELQEETMKTRMQPIGNVVTKFQRVVRDLAGTLQKKINLNLHGTETELDKTLIEAVKDPLTHIVRNSCDHGIEFPEQRKASGKSEVGNITIKAYHEGGQVIIAISDDGKGLSREKLLMKALEKGIVDQVRADKMSDREVQGLIFAPGFSTAEKVTNVSGRGVGMDVVKSNIEKIGGLVDISSIEGAGTTITLKIPLTLAIVPAMIVRSANDRFAIPQVKLVELVRVERHAIEMVQGRKIYRLRGNILPLIDMKEVLNTEDTDAQNEEAFNIVVLNSEKILFGLIVDEILDTADIVVKPLARFLKSISIYSGATVLGDGNVAFIMDVLGIAQTHFGSTELAEESRDHDKYSDQSNEDELREFVLMKLGTQTKHALPLSFVSRMEEFKTNTIELSGLQRVVRYRGGILKIVSLNEILGYPLEDKKDITHVIVTKSGEQMLGLEVDQIIDVLSTRDHLAESITENRYIQGNLVTNAEIIVVLDVERIFTPPSNVARMTRESLSSPRILLVEDTDSIRNSIALSLRNEGWEVDEAVDGIDGLKKIAELRCGYDLIVSDIEMPRMNGYEFARKVRGIGQLKDIPLIAFTTKNSPEDIREAKQAGFNTYLEKGKGRLLPLLVTECLNSRKRKLA